MLSPGTKEKDFLIKFNKYMETGVREYWLLDVKARRLTLIVFLGNGQSEREERVAEGRIALKTFDNSAASGLFIDFDKVFTRVKP
jgi:Uma2 family endonuclease